MNIWALAALVFLVAGMCLPVINQLIHLVPLSLDRFLVIAVVEIGVVLLIKLKKLPGRKQK